MITGESPRPLNMLTVARTGSKPKPAPMLELALVELSDTVADSCEESSPVLVPAHA